MNQKAEDKQLRVMYAGGPGDLVSDLDYWVQGIDNPRVLDVTYSSQLFTAAADEDVELWAYSCCAREDTRNAGNLHAENWPYPSGKGWRWHWAEIKRTIAIARKAYQKQADVLIVTDRNYSFIYLPLRFLGIRVVPSLHCTIWPSYRPLGKAQRMILWLNSWFWKYGCYATVAHYRDCVDQVRELSGSRTTPIRGYLPWYRKDRFASIKPAQFSKRPFRLLFLGRLVPEKGIYDLIRIAKLLKQQGADDFVIDICGVGPEEQPLKKAIKEAGLQEVLLMHGFCSMADSLAKRLNETHILITPTTSQIVEGCNATIIEAILARRPVIASHVCPSIDLVGQAGIKIQAGDIRGYVDAIQSLMQSEQHYQQVLDAADGLASEFTSGAHSWYQAIAPILNACKNGTDPAPKPEFIAKHTLSTK